MRLIDLDLDVRKTLRNIMDDDTYLLTWIVVQAMAPGDENAPPETFKEHEVWRKADALRNRLYGMPLEGIVYLPGTKRIRAIVD